MTDLLCEIRPISMDEWLPDGCMGFGEAIGPATDRPGSGCDSLQPYTRGRRSKLVGMYREVLERHGCCGFVAWLQGRIPGYNNFVVPDVPHHNDMTQRGNRRAESRPETPQPGPETQGEASGQGPYERQPEICMMSPDYGVKWDSVCGLFGIANGDFG